MKRNKIFSMVSAALVVAGMGMSSCADKLDLAPIDWYGSGNFWTTEAQAIGNMSALMTNLRSDNFKNTITFGELRGGAYSLETTCSDGSTLNGSTLTHQNLSQTNHADVGNFGGYYDRLKHVNLAISKITEATYFSKESTKEYCLGMAYGIRAYYYFILYRNFGGVPLRLVPDVENGNYDVSTMYKERAKASEVLTQIKSDIAESLKHFGDQTTFNFNNASKNAKYYWSKAATEMLAGEVYLWSAKVAVGDQAAIPADLTTAKTYFTNVIDNYGLALQGDFANVFSASNERNSEIILAYPYSETEGTNGLPVNYGYGIVTGNTIGSGFDIDGNLWDNPNQIGATQTRYQYSNALWFQFDAEDTRRDATLVSSWHDADATQLRGTFTRKLLGNISNTTNYRAYDADQPVYRLALAYLSLAEIANMEDKGEDVEKYINKIRERAYGANWDAATYGYKAGSFLANEVAILHEKDKEFIQEGQRWYDVRRMTSVKGGEATDHLVFCNEGHIAYGLNLTANMLEASGVWDKANPLHVEPLLDKAQAYKVLWPLSTAVLNDDETLEQTPGYEM